MSEARLLNTAGQGTKMVLCNATSAPPLCTDTRSLLPRKRTQTHHGEQLFKPPQYHVLVCSSFLVARPNSPPLPSFFSAYPPLSFAHCISSSSHFYSCANPWISSSVCLHCSYVLTQERVLGVDITLPSLFPLPRCVMPPIR